MSLYDASVPHSKHTLQAHSPVVQKTLARTQVISCEDVGSVLVLSKLENAQLLGATLRGQHWVGSEIATSEITATEFVCGTLKNVKFDRCALNGVIFTNCFLENVRFDGEDLPKDVKFVGCTILDENGHLAKLQGLMDGCVYLAAAELTVVPPKPVRQAAPVAAKKETAVPTPEAKPDQVAPSRFTSLDV